MKIIHPFRLGRSQSALAAILLISVVLIPAQFIDTAKELAASPAADKTLPVQIEAVTTQPPPNDPLQSLTPGEFQGKLVYIARVPVKDPKPHWQHFLVLRRFNKETDDTGSVTTVRIKVAERAFDPQFSPDGNRVLFKVGWPYDRYGSYELYLWDIKTNKITRGPQETLTYRIVRWSPDGQYLAYIRGGDIEGNVRWKNDQLELFIHSLKTSKSRVVSRGRGVTSFAWTHQNTLLYASLPEKPQPPKPTEGEADKTDTTRPDIYEVAAGGGEPKLAFKDGYRPAPSPDGKWIACFTSTQPDKNEVIITRFLNDVPRQAYLCLYNRAENKRYILRPEKDAFSDLRWTADSKQLINVKQIYQGTGVGEAQVSVSNIDTMQTNQISVLNAKDSKFIVRPNYAPQFLTDHVFSSDLLSVKVYEIKSINGQLKGFGDLRLVNLRSGGVSVFCRFQSVSGYDWHSELGKK